MRKVVLYIAMSLDGYIADEKGKVDWLTGENDQSEEKGTYFDFEKTIDTVILGYNTYAQVVNELSVGKWPYPTMKGYVLTNKDIEGNEQVKFIKKSAKDLIEIIKIQKGKDIWICGGANIVNQFIKEDLIDEYRISIIPIILGNGIRLFGEDNNEIKLKLMNKEFFNGMTELTYIRR